MSLVSAGLRYHEAQTGEAAPDLDALLTTPEPVLLPHDLLDGWGRPILFRPLSDGAFELRSLGADGEAGGEGDDADIVLRHE